MIDELMTELSSAMRYNPDLSVQEVIKLALTTKNPSRNYWASPVKRVMKYKATNSDILTALKTYNTMRQKDSATYHRRSA
jgi:hypothetical protein